MKSRSISMLGAVLFVSASWASSAAVIRYQTTLSGEAEDPPVNSPGVGTAMVTHNTVAQTLRIEIEFSGLIGDTTVAHIHAPTAVPGAGNAGVAVSPGTFPGFPVGVTAGTYDRTFDLTSTSSYTAAFLTLGGGTVAGAEAALATAMDEGRAYVNIHTTIYPGGEIRGFLARVRPVPDASSTAPMLAVTLLGLGFAARNCRRRAERPAPSGAK